MKRKLENRVHINPKWTKLTRPKASTWLGKKGYKRQVNTIDTPFDSKQFQC